MSITSFITAIASSASGDYWISTITDSAAGSSNHGSSPVITLLSTGEVVMSAKSWRATSKTAAIKLDLSGNVDWAREMTPASGATAQYGIARDSNDNIYVPFKETTTTQMQMCIFNSNGGTQSVNDTGGWSDQQAQNLQKY